jgi:hypothetical protein
MIKAIEDALLCGLGGVVTSHWKPRALALSVCEAMACAHRSSVKVGCRQQIDQVGSNNLGTI